MMKRIAIMAIIVTLHAVTIMADTRLDKAAADYNQELYNQALAAYLAQEKTGEVSADLFYNIGNTYYRLKDNAHAILYYERALLLDPSHSDARYNVDFVRTRAGIDEDRGANIFSLWIEGAVGRLSSNTWAIVSLVAFLVMLLALSAYIFMDIVSWRKLGFFGAILSLLIAVLSMICAWQMHTRSVSHRQAIVMASPASLSTSPRQPKDKTEVAFELAAGFMVTVTDSVTTAGVKWCHVETASGRRAWIKADDVAII